MFDRADTRYEARQPVSAVWTSSASVLEPVREGRKDSPARIRRRVPCIAKPRQPGACLLHARPAPIPPAWVQWWNIPTFPASAILRSVHPDLNSDHESLPCLIYLP